MSLWHSLGRQLAHPTGWTGSLVGAAMRVVNREPNRLAIAALDLRPNDHVLELGYGPGEAIAIMARMVPDGSITGIDTSAAMYRSASRRNLEAIKRGRVALLQEDFSSLPFEPATFDKVVAINTVYFWKNPIKIVRGIYRVLRTGGRLVIYATAAETMKNWKFARTDTHEHIDVAQLRTILVGGGFGDENVRIKPCVLPGSVRGLVAVATREENEDRAPALKPGRQTTVTHTLRSGIGVASLLAVAMAVPASGADLKVTMTGVRQDQGKMHVALYANPDGFRHEERALRREIAEANGTSVAVDFKDLAPGRYAVMAYQDTNNDGRLDLRFGMFPKEGWGLSNDPKVMGPPSFSASAFNVSANGAQITVPIHY